MPLNPYFAFALQADEAEQLYRLMNLLSNRRDELRLSETEQDFVESFRGRVLDFTRRHPCRYGSEVL